MLAETRQTIEKSIKTDAFPSLPAYIVQVSREMEKDNVSVIRIAELVSQDVGLAGRVLRLANSAIYSRSAQKTVSIDSAVQRIGFAEMRNVCMSVGVARHFEEELEHLSIAQLWKHSLCVAFATQAVIDFCRKDISRRLSHELLYTAGLMHDIGLVVLNRQMASEYARVMTEWEAGHDKLWQIEKSVLGFDHAEVGSWVVRHWGLPEDLISAVRYHHEHELADNRIAPLAKLLHVADVIAGMNGFGALAEERIEPFDISAWVDLGLDDRDIPRIIEETDRRIQTAELFAVLARGN